MREAASRPAVETLHLLDAALFNLVVGNADAHGENFSLLYHADVTLLAPLYDLMCTTAYPDVSAKPAMKIAGTSKLTDLNIRSWKHFSDEIVLGFPYLRRRIKEICLAVDVRSDLQRCGLGSLMHGFVEDNVVSRGITDAVGVVAPEYLRVLE